MENIIVQERPPVSPLTPYIQTYWMGQFNVSGTEQAHHTVLPNGTIELIIHLTDTHCRLDPGGKSFGRSPYLTLMGLYDEPYDVQFHKQVDVFGIRFHPDGIRSLFGVPPSEFSRTFGSADEILGKYLREFGDRIRVKTSFMDQADLADRMFLTHFVQSEDPTHYVMHRIRKTGGMEDYETITREMTVSRRHLQRLFKAYYGISPRDYLRLMRMNTIQRCLKETPESLTGLSYDLNFSDQSHFIREFRNYTGMTPGKFLRDSGKYIINPLPGPDWQT